jgi:chromosome segregation ATPase
MNSVIKPWLVAGLTIALACSVILSGVLILKLGRFDEAKRQAEEAEGLAARKQTELAALQVEIESLTKQKDALAPTVADWEKRLSEKAAAEASLATLEAKQKQSESDVVRAGKRLDETTRAMLDAEKQKSEVSATIEKLKSELLFVTKSNNDAKALLALAVDAENRLSNATNAIINTDSRRKQLEADVESAQSRFAQLQKEADALRQTRETLTTEVATLRQQIQTLKDQLASSDKQAAEFKARQSATQEEEQKLAKAQQRLATAETRASELETQQRQTTAALTQLTNRLEQARNVVAEWEAKRDATQQTATKAGQDLSAAQALLVQTTALQDQRAREQATLVAQIAATKKELEQARKDAADAEARLDIAKAVLQKADADLAGVRKSSHELSTKHGELTREVSRLEASLERLKKEKEALEKEIGRQEAQPLKASPAGQ